MIIASGPLVGAFSVIVNTGCGTDGSFYSTSVIYVIAPVAAVTCDNVVGHARARSSVPVPVCHPCNHQHEL